MNTRDFPLNVRITVEVPRDGQRLCHAIEIAAFEEERAFSPLPREREIPFAHRERMLAIEQKERRRLLVDYVARKLADGILKAIESRDPQHGYNPEELASQQ